MVFWYFWTEPQTASSMAILWYFDALSRLFGVQFLPEAEIYSNNNVVPLPTAFNHPGMAKDIHA